MNRRDALKAGAATGLLGAARRPPDDEAGDLTAPELDQLQLNTLMYYLHETNPDNWLVRDKTAPTAPASIAAVGLALATLPVVVERGVIIREFAAKIARRRLRFLLDCPQGPEPDASGYKGFFYHFLDLETGRRARQCELSTVDSAFLLAGALAIAAYFDRDTADEAEVRGLADALYRRADWDWARDGGPTLTHGSRRSPGSSRTAGGATTRGCCSTSSALARPPTPCRRRAIALLRDVSVEDDLRPGAALLGPALHAPALAPVGRLPRHPRRVHAGARQRLFREQPSGDLRPAGVRGPQPAGLRGVWPALLGVHGLRRPRPGAAHGRRGRARVLRLRRARCPVRPGRRHGGPLGRGRLAAVRRRSSPRRCASSPGWTWG